MLSQQRCRCGMPTPPKPTGLSDSASTHSPGHVELREASRAVPVRAASEPPRTCPYSRGLGHPFLAEVRGGLFDLAQRPAADSANLLCWVERSQGRYA